MSLAKRRDAEKLLRDVRAEPPCAPWCCLAWCHPCRVLSALCGGALREVLTVVELTMFAVHPHAG